MSAVEALEDWHVGLIWEGGGLAELPHLRRERLAPGAFPRCLSYILYILYILCNSIIKYKYSINHHIYIF